MVQTKKTRKTPPKDVQQQVDRLLVEIKKLTSKASEKYKTLDTPTKKKINVGLGLLAALVAGASIIQKTRKRK